MPTTLIAHLLCGKWQADSPLYSTHSNRWSEGKKQFHPPTEETLTCSGSRKMQWGPRPRLLQQAPFPRAQEASLPPRALPAQTSSPGHGLRLWLCPHAAYLGGSLWHSRPRLPLETRLSPKVQGNTSTWHSWASQATPPGVISWGSFSSAAVDAGAPQGSALP